MIRCWVWETLSASLQQFRFDSIHLLKVKLQPNAFPRPFVSQPRHMLRLDEAGFFLIFPLTCNNCWPVKRTLSVYLIWLNFFIIFTFFLARVQFLVCLVCVSKCSCAQRILIQLLFSCFVLFMCVKMQNWKKHLPPLPSPLFLSPRLLFAVHQSCLSVCSNKMYTSCNVSLIELFPYISLLVLFVKPWKPITRKLS